MALIAVRFETSYCQEWIPTCGKHVVPPNQLRFPFIRILKFCDRAWFSTDSELKHLVLCSHTSMGSLGKQARLTWSVRREWRHQDQTLIDLLGGESCIVSVCVRNMARSMQQDVVRVAAKSRVAGQTLAWRGRHGHCCCGSAVKTARIPYRKSPQGCQAEARVHNAKDGNVHRHRVVETVHPVDAIEANSKRDRDLEAAYKRIADKYARVCDPTLNSSIRGLQQALTNDEEYQQLSQTPDSRPWWEF